MKARLVINFELAVERWQDLKDEQDMELEEALLNLSNWLEYHGGALKDSYVEVESFS